MVEWFKNLSEGWETGVFAGGVAVHLAVIGGIIKYFWSKNEVKTI